jgi:hypothetical protein
MRRRPSTMPLLVASILTSSVAMADAVPAARDLGPGEVREHLKGVDAAIGQCYLGAVGERAGAGKLEVVLSIHRKGLVDHIDVRAPGLPAKLVAKIDGCVRAALTGITFPARRIGTTAVVPYFWQKTAAADAGPQESCWDAKGCKDGEPQQHVAQSKKFVTNRQARRAPRS